MTPDEAKARVAAIAEIEGDDETAHYEEDRLYENVLRAIAAGVDDPAQLAAIALTATDLEFTRWYA